MTTDLHVMPRIRMRGTVLPLLDMPSWCVQSQLDLYQFRYLKIPHNSGTKVMCMLLFHLCEMLYRKLQHKEK
jgi:hypothetical protein